MAAIPVAFLLALAPPASAHGSSNLVWAVNEDGPNAFVTRFGWDLQRITGENAVASNAAVAVAFGHHTRTRAMAWQIVLASRVGNLVAPDNFAGSGGDCVSCDTSAMAYQFVVATNDVLQFSPATNAKLAELRERATALGRSTEPTPVVTARADALAREVQQVIAATIPPPHHRAAGERSAAAPGVLVRRMIDHR